LVDLAVEAVESLASEVLAQLVKALLAATATQPQETLVVVAVERLAPVASRQMALAVAVVPALLLLSLE
jgi:hypothetical protein